MAICRYLALPYLFLFSLHAFNHCITLMFDLLLWAFKIDKHGIVMTKRLFYIEDICICISHTRDDIKH